MSKKLIVTLGLATALMCSASAGFAKDKPGQKFIDQAIQGNLAEVAMGQLAQQNGASEDVRSFGQTLVTDHTAANQKAMAAAQAIGVTPPAEPSKKQQKAHDKLAKLSGDAFDRQFKKDMVADHKKDIAEYEKEAKRSDGQVSDYASGTLPTLEKHLQIAQSLGKGAGKTGMKTQ